jgi:hypothetical protein
MPSLLAQAVFERLLDPDSESCCEQRDCASFVDPSEKRAADQEEEEEECILGVGRRWHPTIAFRELVLLADAVSCTAGRRRSFASSRSGLVSSGFLPLSTHRANPCMSHRAFSQEVSRWTPPSTPTPFPDLNSR